MSLFSKDGKDEHHEPRPDGDRSASDARPTSREDSKMHAETRRSEMANIGKSISIKGDLSGDEDMVIEGKVEGSVELPNAQLTVGVNGKVQAEIRAKSIVIVGHVKGNVQGTERVEVQGSGVIEGDLTAPRLIVAEGAVVNGSIQMTKSESVAVPARREEVRQAG